MKVRDVMTYGVISVPEGASIAEAVETMLRSRVSALFVFDAGHALSGGGLQVLRIARHGAGECYISADVADGDIRGVDPRVEVQLLFDRRADVLSFGHLPTPSDESDAGPDPTSIHCLASRGGFGLDSRLAYPAAVAQ